MESSCYQPSLFDADTGPDLAAAASARQRMRDMIDGLSAATEPPWLDQMEAILMDGSFRRAMWSVPKAEAEALWVEYDSQVERLYAVLASRVAADASV